jgi:putative oxidoreductase
MNSTESLGKLVVRLTVGILLLLHGLHKLLDGIGPIEHMLADHGLPNALAYGVYLGEILGPILVILGLFSRIGGLLIVIDMAVAVFLAGMGNLFAFNPATGGYALELEAFYLFGGLAVMLMGAGSLSLGGREGRWN